MSELQKEKDADAVTLREATTRDQAPAWVGEAPGAYVVGADSKLVGWSERWSIETDGTMPPIPGEEHVPRYYRKRVYLEVMRLTPRAVIDLGVHDNKGYRGIFDGSRVFLRQGDGSVPALSPVHVVWAEYDYWKTREPLLRNVVLCSHEVSPGEIEATLKWARKSQKELQNDRRKR